MKIKMGRIRGLNAPYTRTGLIFGGCCQIIDGIIIVLSLGYLNPGLNMQWTDNQLKRSFMWVIKEIDREEYNRTTCNRCEDCTNEQDN